MKKFFEEFKKFINRGSVMDLAVGMMIGSAFTAIVNSFVNSILKPLINWIPGTDSASALQTVLREAVVDEKGNVVTNALILDWGAVISAIITFLLTALILFVIVKLMNSVKDGLKDVKTDIKTKNAKKHKKGKNEPVVEEAPVEEAPKVVEPPKPTTEELLEKIVVLLEKEQTPKE